MPMAPKGEKRPAESVRGRGAKRANVFRFDDCGHVPPLMTRNQIEVVTNFLEAGRSSDE